MYASGLFNVLDTQYIGTYIIYVWVYVSHYNHVHSYEEYEFQ